MVIWKCLSKALIQTQAKLSCPRPVSVAESSTIKGSPNDRNHSSFYSIGYCIKKLLSPLQKIHLKFILAIDQSYTWFLLYPLHIVCADHTIVQISTTSSRAHHTAVSGALATSWDASRMGLLAAARARQPGRSRRGRPPWCGSRISQAWAHRLGCDNQISLAWAHPPKLGGGLDSPRGGGGQISAIWARWRCALNGDASEAGIFVLMQNLHPAPSTQQAEQSWLNMRTDSKACQSIFLKLTKGNAVRCQSLELAGWYQTVPYLQLGSHVRWHIAMRSYLSTDLKIIQDR
jgi:hypothetical protein